MTTDTTEKITLADAENEEQRVQASFRNRIEIEKFYRFLHENNLRGEAAIVLKRLLSSIRKPLGLKKGSKT